VKAVGGVLSASLLLSASVSAAPPAASRARLFRHEGTRLSMACAYTIVAYGPDAQALPPTVEAALDEVDRIDRLMSHYRRDSPLSRLNREAAHGPCAVPPELLDFLTECLRWSRESDGAFDVTVGPLMKAWGFFRGEGREMLGETGFEHEAHGLLKFFRFQFGIGCTFKRVLVWSMRQHHVVQAHAARHKAFGLGIINAVNIAHHF